MRRQAECGSSSQWAWSWVFALTMKATLILITAILVTPCIASKPDSRKEPDFPELRVEPLPFPKERKTVERLSVGEIEAGILALNEKIGGYPPRLKDASERQAVYLKWSELLLAAQAVKKTEGDSERVACALAALFRQGHNMDVQKCGLHAKAIIEEALASYPDSIPVNWQASYFYLQINPKFAPEGEKALLRLRKLLGTDQNPEVERGLVFAYMYQQRVPEARAQIDRCLVISPGDKMLLQFKDSLKDGKLETRTVK